CLFDCRRSTPSWTRNRAYIRSTNSFKLFPRNQHWLHLTLLMRKLLSISLLIVAAAGCTHLMAPEPQAPTSASVGYAWPDSDATYTYQSDADTHIIHVSKGGTITDL